MEITLKSKSWHVWLYKWTYGVQEVPNNLCAYFWGALLSVLMVPVFTWMPLVVEYVNLKINKGDGQVFGHCGLGMKYILTIIICAAVFFLFTIGVVFFEHTAPSIVITAIIALGIFIIWFFKKKRILPKTTEAITKGVINITISEPVIMTKEFIKAKKNKYCPKINWK